MIDNFYYLVPFIFLILFLLNSLTIGIPMLKIGFLGNVKFDPFSFLDKINFKFNIFNIKKEQLRSLHRRERLLLLNYCIIAFTIAIIFQLLLGFIINLCCKNIIALFACVIVQILGGLLIVNIWTNRETYH